MNHFLVIVFLSDQLSDIEERSSDSESPDSENEDYGSYD